MIYSFVCMLISMCPCCTGYQLRSKSLEHSVTYNSTHLLYVLLLAHRLWVSRVAPLVLAGQSYISLWGLAG